MGTSFYVLAEVIPLSRSRSVIKLDLKNSNPLLANVFSKKQNKSSLRKFLDERFATSYDAPKEWQIIRLFKAYLEKDKNTVSFQNQLQKQLDRNPNKNPSQVANNKLMLNSNYL